MRPYRVSILAAAIVLAGTLAFAVRAHAHDTHKGFSAGEPGDPRKPARTVEVIMKEEYGALEFVPKRIEVKRNEQIRFVLKNSDNQTHEFLLASAADNLKHAAPMRKYPDMVHDDLNGKTLQPNGASEILWRFSKRGTFEFACLIPGHREAGMIGTVIVK